MLIYPVVGVQQREFASSLLSPSYYYQAATQIIIKQISCSGDQFIAAAFNWSVFN